MQQIIDTLYLGDINSGITAITSLQFHFVLNCARDCNYTTPAHFMYKHLLLNDDPNEKIFHLFDINIELIDKYISVGKSVLIHCYSGKSRSGSFVLAYLMKIKNMTLVAAYDYVRSRRKILPNLSFMKELIKYDKQIHGNSSFDFDNYTITFIVETFDLNKKKVTYAFYNNNKSFDETIDALFPYE